ncbi:MAG: sulfatase-like hydrolase/transferase [Acidobacteriota bacterium]|nr:sulfatase-like hydrolase/transferase [Acidobacteriota bacterium]
MRDNPPTRRALLGALPAAAVAARGQGEPAASRPNIIIVNSDQFRWDCIGAMGLNPMNLTPNIDRMAQRGTLFRHAFSAQPVCAPARASIITGQYPARHGVWRNGIGIREDATTIATEMGRAGYSCNYIGKWHLGPPSGEPRSLATRGPVLPQHRGGFTGLWEAANELEWTSHAYEGDLYDNDGKSIHFENEYRAEFMTGRVERFLRSQAARSPFLLYVSYLEVHHQNDKDTFDPPKAYVGRYKNPFIPPDLRPLPGTWPSQLADYYGCVTAMDDCVGRIRALLGELALDRNTILVFTADHACHFRTRNAEYKRSPHESSIHIPLVIEGPGFNRGMAIDELVSQVDYAPSLLAACGLSAPSSMQGHSFLPLLDRKTEGWRNEVYFEMSEFVTGRGLRTPRYTYAAMAPKQPGWRATPHADQYVEYVLYDNYADPAQQVNLAGRVPYREAAQELRKRMIERVKESSGLDAAIQPCWFPYS